MAAGFRQRHETLKSIAGGLMELTFAEVVETVDSLPADEKEMLIDIIKKRLTEERREEMYRSIEEARAEYEQGLCKPMTVDEIMAEISS